MKGRAEAEHYRLEAMRFNEFAKWYQDQGRVFEDEWYIKGYVTDEYEVLE